jgi:protoporphyrinogen oxidase
VNVILGAGLTGLGAARTSGFTVFEQASGPGGICRSYYLRPGSTQPLEAEPDDGEAYRFEVGGGHWLFGGPPEAIDLIDALTPLRHHRRRAGVWLRSPDRLVAYPLQAHLDGLGGERAEQAAKELANRADRGHGDGSMRDWLRAEFGPTLFDAFFAPFHERYTAGLFHSIEPQDAYKTPSTPTAGYNATFAYPDDGLDELTRRLASPDSTSSDVRYGHRVTQIDTDRRVVRFERGDEVAYETLLSTLPLDVTLGLAGLDVAVSPDPHTSVLVLNIGAERGPAGPDVHWLYEPASDAGFHRIGFYSSVDAHFVPRSRRAANDAAALYVERAFVGGTRPDPGEVERYGRAVVDELQSRRFIGEVEVLDPSWVDVAYTWTAIGSDWKRLAIETLMAHDIEPVGRYARWHFQGMAESLADGMAAGRAARERARP